MVVRAGTDKSHPGYNTKNRALINLRGGQYGRTLKVGINGGVKVEHKLPNGANAEEDPPKVDAQAIGAALRGLLVAAYRTIRSTLGPAT
ncbi:non-contractile tail tubular protein [Enterobacter phage 02_vB_Eclo_IJM]|nr:non-contractile tail tubular protein [Enterobacter phage 02_vB_Eclo_IJM]